MKKIVLMFVFLLLAQGFASADEILDSRGMVMPCKIETVCDGLIEYTKDGCLYSIQREMNQPIFNDYVDVQTKLFDKTSVVRYTGRVVLKDFASVKIRTENGDMAIPWYRVKFIGMFNPKTN